MKLLLGKISGLCYLVTFFVFVPYFILISDSFNSTIFNFDPLSNLGTLPETEKLYNFLLIVEGILLFSYYNNYLSNSRSEYIKYTEGQYFLKFGKIAGLGQAGLGLFANTDSFHILHALSAIFFFLGISFSVFSISLLYAHSLEDNNNLSKFSLFGIGNLIFGLLYPFYFRFSWMKGIWQLLIVIWAIIWYISEYYIYTNYEISFRQLNKFDKLHEINKIALIFMIIGLLLISISFVFYFIPELEPIKCGLSDNPLPCHPIDNLINLIFGAIITIISVLNYNRNESSYD